MRTRILAAVLTIGLVAATRADDGQPAFLRVYVPSDAVLTVNGQDTRQTGDLRRFVTPNLVPLPAGKAYRYELKITFTIAGKVETRTRTVVVEPGKEAEVDLRDAAKTDVVPPAPKEAPREAPRPEPKREAPPTPKEPKEKPAAEGTIVVPYVATPETVVAAMLKLAQVKEGDVVYDLGCGDGRIVVAAVKDFKAKRGVGIDLSAERVKESEANAKKVGVQDRTTFRQGDVLKLDSVADADVVTLYLLPEVNEKLLPMLQRTLKPGARVVSHDYHFGDAWKPEKTEKMVIEDEEHRIFLWTVPGPKKE